MTDNTHSTSHNAVPDEVTPGQAFAMSGTPGVILLDVREDDEWDSGHAPQARHMPLNSLDASQLAGHTVLAICRSGARSAKAVEFLTRAGIEAHNVAGGMMAWHEAGLAVVTDDPTQRDLQ